MVDGAWDLSLVPSLKKLIRQNVRISLFKISNEGQIIEIERHFNDVIPLLRITHVKNVFIQFNFQLLFFLIIKS